MNTETTNQSGNSQKAPYVKPKAGAEITDLKTIPKDFTDTVISKVKEKRGNAMLPKFCSARENGSYRGKVVVNGDNYLVQAVGKDENFLIVHDKKRVELQGNELNDKNEKKCMNGFDIQVHYSKAQGKVYPYSREKEAQKIQAARDAKAERNNATLSQEAFAEKAQSYANDNIKNANQRKAFLKHFGALSQEFQKTSPTKDAAQSEKTQEQQQNAPER